jgi:broad specificity phosphatase PhoE
VVRHGQSAGNVARDLADAAGAAMIDIDHRDMDVPLSDLGEAQARSLGHWFAAMPEDERPQVVLASPYARAVRTAELIGAGDKVTIDERLREREFGVLDRLTTLGIHERFPEQAEHRAILGKFYHRPPGGESWCDVILRLRSALDTISLHHADKRVLIVGHQVVVLCLRYILEDLTEAEILAIDREGDVANCGVTEYDFRPDCPDECRPTLTLYNFTAPLAAEGTPVTAEPDAKVAAE